MRFKDLLHAGAGIGGWLSLAAAFACTPVDPAGPPPDFDPAPPAARDVLPRHAALLNSPPMAVDPDALAGVWRSGECRIDMDAGTVSGAARLSGDCPAPLIPVTGWRLEPEQRMRIDLIAGEADAPVWSGLMTSPNRLTGRAGALGGWVWTRDAAAASTHGPGAP